MSGAGIVTDGLVFCIDAASKRSYPGSGTVLTDIAHQKSWDLINGPVVNTEEGQGSIHLDGTNDYINFTNDGTLDIGTSDFTIFVWIKLLDYGSYTHLFTFDHQNMFGWKAGNSSYGPGDVYFYGGSSYRSVADSFGEWSLSLNEWTMLALARIGTELYGYKNGEYIGSHSESTTKDITATNVKIGHGWSSEYTEQFRGPTYFYDKALTANEIRQNYLATRGRFQ